MNTELVLNRLDFKRYRSIRAIKEDHTGHWFDPKTMNFFDTIVSNEVYKDHLFIYSNQMQTSAGMVERQWKISICIEGTISGLYSDFGSLEEAEEFIVSLPSYFVEYLLVLTGVFFRGRGWDLLDTKKYDKVKEFLADNDTTYLSNNYVKSMIADYEREK